MPRADSDAKVGSRAGLSYRQRESRMTDDGDELFTLNEACKVFFKDAITSATLRAEAGRGRLVIERIGRRQFVTRAAIPAMRKQCEIRVPESPESNSNLPSRDALAIARRRAQRLLKR